MARPARVGLERLKRAVHFLDEALKAAQDPAIDFRALGVRHVLLVPLVAVRSGVEREEVVRVVKGAKELALHLTDARHVKLEVVPWLGVGDHVPACGIRPVGGKRLKRVDRVAEALGHFLAVLVQDQTVGHHALVRHLVEHHGRDGVQGVEPPARLVDALRDEVRGIRCPCVHLFLVLEGIVPLGVRHASAVEPHVDQIRFATHRTAVAGHQDHLVHHVLVEVHFVVVRIGHVPHVRTPRRDSKP